MSLSAFLFLILPKFVPMPINYKCKKLFCWCLSKTHIWTPIAFYMLLKNTQFVCALPIARVCCINKLTDSQTSATYYHTHTDVNCMVHYALIWMVHESECVLLSRRWKIIILNRVLFSNGIIRLVAQVVLAYLQIMHQSQLKNKFCLNGFNILHITNKCLNDWKTNTEREQLLKLLHGT